MKMDVDYIFRSISIHSNNTHWVPALITSVSYKEGNCCPDCAPFFNGESANSLIFNKLADFSGERGIRTPGPVKINGFQDRRIRPLCHLSKVECYFAPCHVFREMDCKDKYFFRNRKRLGGKSVKNIENGGSGRWIADKNDYLAGCIENTSNTQEY